MGLVYADLELINGTDIEMARRHLMGEEEVKRVHVNMLVDSGSMFMCINEHIRDQLHLSVVERKRAELANGEIIEYEVVGPIEVRFRNRRCNVDAIVLPGGTEPLLGAIPMEGMDILIHPRRQELVFNPEHPDHPVAKLKMVSVAAA